MGMYQLYRQQVLPAELQVVWDFIADPKNLKQITPEYLGFEILTTSLPETMYPGMVIAYRVSPVLGIKLTWVSEITHIREKEFFIDEQKVGPYKLWHHQHKLTATNDGTLMEDIVNYAPPLGVVGDLLNKLFITKQLQEIFDYRFHALEKVFPEN